MKLPFLFALTCTCTCGPLAWAQSEEPTLAAMSVETVASVQPSAATREAVAPSRLRDVFQPAAKNAEEPFKPFRLSSEERQRLREQVRGQYAFETPKQ